MDFTKGRYWDLPWSLVSGCTPCIATHPERLSIPLKRRKPTAFSVWNDLFHEDVPFEFILAALSYAVGAYDRHKYLILTKRPKRMADFFAWMETEAPHSVEMNRECWWHGLTVCNQQEADEKIPVFLQVPGKKFLSIEPMLGAIDLWAIKDGSWWDREGATRYNALTGTSWWGSDGSHGLGGGPKIDAVILGGETGPGARPLHPDWVRKVRDDCAAAGVPFFFKQWGEFAPNWLNDDDGNKIEGSEWMDKIGRKKAGRLLDGRTHDDLAWVVEAKP